MYIFVPEAKNLTILDYFIEFLFKLFTIIELLKEVINWCGWIPMYCHAIKIGCDVGGGDGSVLSV